MITILWYLSRSYALKQYHDGISNLILMVRISYREY